MMADSSDWWFAPFGGSFVFTAIVLIIWYIQYMHGETKKKETLRNAHDKIVELRQKGIRADICAKCKGMGVGAWGFYETCKVCGGIGYTYDMPSVSKDGETR